MSYLTHSELSGVELNPNSIHWVPPMYMVPHGKWGMQEKEGRVPVLRELTVQWKPRNEPLMLWTKKIIQG